MQTLATIQHQLGVMTLPLALLSTLAVMIILERILFLTLNSNTRSKSILQQLKAIHVEDQEQFNLLIHNLTQQKGTLPQGIALLLSHRNFTKALREDTANVWLSKKRQQYNAGLRFLSVIGVISPLIGLLGTVLGLITMFDNLALTSGSVAPSDLADGLGLAMSTTAAGLIIAVPAIFGSQILQLWADRAIARIEHTMNHCNLYLEGISLEAERQVEQAYPNCSQTCEQAAALQRPKEAKAQ